MRAPAFKRLLTQLQSLTRRQQQELAVHLRSPVTEDPAAAVRVVVCPHCDGRQLHAWGRTPTGLPRSRCRTCLRTSTALTGTPFARFQHRQDWPGLMRDVADGMPVLQIAERRHVHRNTATRWVRRWLEQAPTGRTALHGLVEADEVFVRRSAKGRRAERVALGRNPRKRGGGSSVGRGRHAAEHQPVLVARSRTGATAGFLLPGLTAKVLDAAATEVVAPGAVLITDSSPAWCAASDGGHRHHELVNVQAGQRTRGAFHLQGVNGSHARFRKFLAAFNGVSTQHLPRYFRWFLLLEQHQHPEGLMTQVLETNTK